MFVRERERERGVIKQRPERQRQSYQEKTRETETKSSAKDQKTDLFPEIDINPLLSISLLTHSGGDDG